MTAIMLFKVIQGHRFWYQPKAHMLLLAVLVINTNKHPISRHFQVIADHWSNLSF